MVNFLAGALADAAGLHLELHQHAAGVIAVLVGFFGEHRGHFGTLLLLRVLAQELLEQLVAPGFQLLRQRLEVLVVRVERQAHGVFAFRLELGVRFVQARPHGGALGGDESFALLGCHQLSVS
ncbi:hypothetical protein HRF95_29960 [Klebsiella variicola]|nr:hypothetical protein [Klebsiella variicola]